MIITCYHCVLQLVNRSDSDMLPVWCMFNMSSFETRILYTQVDPLSILLWGCACCSLTVLWLTKRDALKIFCLSKNKGTKDREHKTYFTHFLWAITQIKLGKLFFFSLWNAGRNCVKTEQRDCEKWLIVAISLHVWFARLCARVLNSQISVAYSVSVCAQMQGHFRMSSFVEYNVCLCMSSTYRFRTGALLVC